MKKVDAVENSIGIENCIRCDSPDITWYYSDKTEGYYVCECQQCGSFSEVMRADVYEKYKPGKPRKTGDQEEPWISRLTPKGGFSFKDRRTTMIERIFLKIRNKRSDSE
ncbi:MAG: hypothetical protein HQM14_14565 [SAR324 cluster bacterium]|nr:hypothetical protein [SAR324 cluster bacterium]